MKTTPTRDWSEEEPDEDPVDLLDEPPVDHHFLGAPA